MAYGARHVDKNVRADAVMYHKEAEYAGNAIFYGRCPYIVADSDAKWQIKLVTYENGEIITRFADGGKYNKVWDDRETYFPGILPISGPSFPPDTIIEGEITVGGLQIGGRVSEVTLSAGIWTALPGAPLPQRNAISIQNTSNEEIKLNYDYLAPLPATYTGVILGVGNERYYDITDTIVLYAKPKVGPVTITVEELS